MIGGILKHSNDTRVKLRELYEERAAILEFDDGMSREAAEAFAYELVYGDKQTDMFSKSKQYRPAVPR